MVRYIDALNAKTIAAARKAKRAEKAKALWPPKPCGDCGAPAGMCSPAHYLTVKPKKKPRKIPARTLRKRLIKALDKTFSLVVRAKCSKCTFCSGPVEHCFHFVTRAKYSVRWDERNATGSCAGCNYRYEFDPHFAIQWYLSFNGLTAYEQLVRDGNIISKHSNDDLERRLAELKKELESA